VNDVLSGPDNFLLANAPTAAPEILVEKLGERYDVMRASIKRWTTGNPNQAPLDAMEALLKRQPIDPGQVREILVTVPGSLADNDNSGPSDINIQHALAMMLTDKTLTFRSIHDKARMQDPAILGLRAKVRLVTGVRGARPPLLQITLADGTRLSQDTVGAGVLGTPANPMTREQLVAKCRDLMTPVLGAKTNPLIDRVLQLEKIKDIRELRSLLQRPPHGGPPKLSEYPNAKS
jgi:2-methylcitrate dehydratase PrpD